MDYGTTSHSAILPARLSRLRCYLAALIPLHCHSAILAAKIHREHLVRMPGNPRQRQQLGSGMFVSLYRENLLKRAFPARFAY